MSTRSRLAALLFLTFTVGTVSAQRIVLPRGTGGITPGADWTVLRAADMDKAERATDPKQEPAHARLLAVIAELKTRDRLVEHALFHQPGAEAGRMRLVNAYSAEVHATVEQLLADSAIEDMRSALLEALGPGHEFVGHERTPVFEIGGLVLHFDVRADDLHWLLDLYVVPAGKRLQYFEATYAAEDVDARPQIEALLRTFDGATEETTDPTLRGMITGGIAGAVAGVFVALLRRRRQQRLQAMTGRDQNAG